MLIQGVCYGDFQMPSAYSLALEPIYKNRRSGDKAGGTVAAMKGKAVDKGLLYRGKGFWFTLLVIICLPFKGNNRFVIEIMGGEYAGAVTTPYFMRSFPLPNQ